MEYQSKARLEQSGYTVFRTAGSHGAADLIAIDQHTIILVQVKSGPRINDTTALKALPAPPSVKKVVHHWTKQGRVWQLRVVEVEPTCYAG